MQKNNLANIGQYPAILTSLLVNNPYQRPILTYRDALRIVCCQAWSLTGIAIIRSVSIETWGQFVFRHGFWPRWRNGYRDRNFWRYLLPRDGSVNAYGSHWAEMKANRTKMMARHEVKLVKFKWCVLRIFFKLYSKMFFVLCNSNTGHWPIVFICMQSCSCKTTCSRKKTARSEGCPCRNADIKLCSSPFGGK